MPENGLDQFDTIASTNVTLQVFNDVITKVEAYYRTLIETQHAASLSFVRDWENPTVNAYATRIGDQWVVHMFGGLARRPEITPDGFLLVACHELGHHLGGFPYVNEWAANEGQSDYFSTLSCAKTLWAKDSNSDSRKFIPAYPKKLCDNSWKSQADRDLCYRIVLAGKSLADLLSSHTAKFETPDQSQVDATDNQHPAGQCRLDTFIAGALCAVRFDDHSIPESEENSAMVSCLQSRKEIGFRPRCWFLPTF